MLTVLRVAILMIGAATFSAGLAQEAKPGQSEPHDFIVYFPFQSSALTPEADNVVAQAATYAAAQGRKIIIVGHTDTAEREPSKLSLLRANAVGASLYQHGLPDSVQVIEGGLGAKDLSVPTAANVREPMNRNVRVRIQ
jgi:OmpA-OmpF porin, OOP family